MNSSFWLYFIVGVLGIAITTIGILTYIKNNQYSKQPTKEITALIQHAKETINQAKKISSQKTRTAADQQQLQKLIDQAFSDVEAITKQQPDNPNTLHLSSSLYKDLIPFNADAIPLAENALKKAIELSPKDPLLYDDLGMLYIQIKKYDEAEKILRESIEINPNRSHPYLRLGNLYQRKGEKEEAKKMYLRAQQLTPVTHATNSAVIKNYLTSLEE